MVTKGETVKPGCQPGELSGVKLQAAGSRCGFQVKESIAAGFSRQNKIANYMLQVIRLEFNTLINKQLS